jgi:hypothetical protein
MTPLLIQDGLLQCFFYPKPCFINTIYQQIGEFQYYICYVLRVTCKYENLDIINATYLRCFQNNRFGFGRQVVEQHLILWVGASRTQIILSFVV